MSMERWEPAKMNRFSEKVMVAARERAQSMIESGEESVSLDLGEQKAALRLSTNPDRVIGSEKFDIGERTIYIGLPAEEME